MFRLFLYSCLAFVCLTLSACSSISKGVAQAILEQDGPDLRACQIEGAAFDGIRSSIEHNAGSFRTTKVLMVHGISRHVPGYSELFQSKLVNSLGLDVRDSQIRQFKIALGSEPAEGEEDGRANLKITRHTDEREERELLFYELTWSPLTEKEKQKLNFDTTGVIAQSRAGVNAILKDFLNKTVPDLLIYRGNKKDAINSAVNQSVCWMFSGGWEQLPDGGMQACDLLQGPDNGTVLADDFYFVTHSLGSRITIDTINAYAQLAWSQPQSGDAVPLVRGVQDKTFTVFMLSNQLPLLQLGRDVPAVTGQTPLFCGPQAPRADERIMSKLRIVAFSDANDMLSYPIPDDFADHFISSRLCPEIVNININIAPIRDLFGAANFADPLTAHVGYPGDDRVVAIIADGVSRGHRAPLIEERCRWTELR